MAKLKARCVLISQTPRQGEDGEPLFTTNVKLTPIGVPGGDILLSFAKADVRFHEGHSIIDPRMQQPPKTMIAPNALGLEATCYVRGEKACTFRASDPGHPGNPAISGITPAVAARAGSEGGVYEIEFTEVAE